MKTSMAMKLFKYVFSIYFGITVLITASQMYAQYNEQKKDILNELKVKKNSFLKSLADVMWDMSWDKLENVGDGILNMPIIEGVQITYMEKDKFKKGKVFEGKDAESIKDKIDKGEIFFHQFDITKKSGGKEIKIGVAKLYSTQSKVMDRLKFGWGLAVSVVVLQAGLLLFLFLFVFKRVLGRPLESLTKSAESISFKNLNEVNSGLDKKENNELNILERVLNKFIGDLKKSKKNLLESLQENEDMNKALEHLNRELEKKVIEIKDLNNGLELKVEERTIELSKEKNKVSTLLNNIKSGVFSIRSDFKVVPPVSKHSEIIFGEDIVGKKVSEFLFYSIRKGTREYRNLQSVFSTVFNSDKLQFFGLEDNLPKIVTLPDKKNKKGKTLKLSYTGSFNQNDLLETLVCRAEEVTESEEHLKKAEEDQERYVFISEILDVDDKIELGKIMEQSVQSLFEVLEDFVSPLSDTYEVDHFHKVLKDTILGLRKKVMFLPSLEMKVFDHVIALEQFEVFEDYGGQVNPQVEAASIICDILETFLSYSSCVNRFTPVNLNYNLSFKDIILEKIKDIEKIFKNLFEYVFLVRDVDKIDEEKLKKVVQVAKLYPEFERTIDLIQQRSRLLSFLLKGVGEEELSSTYQNLSSRVKIMPERARLTEAIIENNLIEPYKEVLSKTKSIKKELVARIEERQKQFLDDKGYLLLLNKLMKRFIKESKEGPDQSLPPLPKLENAVIESFESFVRMADLNFGGFNLGRETEKEFIEKSTFQIEGIFRNVLKKELTQAKAFPIEKNNKKFIKLLRDYLPKD